MKKTVFPKKSEFSVAMSEETGCIVVVMDAKVAIGSLTREQSVDFCHLVDRWKPINKTVLENESPGQEVAVNGHG
jgi:hypothetical protein